MIELVEKDGKISLKTDLGDAVKDFFTNVITTESLGCAFEPEQPFENPDGTLITFDSDYFGSHRNTAPLPGPFAEYGEEVVVWNK